MGISTDLQWILVVESHYYGMGWQYGAEGIEDAQDGGDTWPEADTSDNAGIDMEPEPVNVLDEEYGSNAPPYPEDAAFFVLVRGQHSHRIKTQKAAPDWTTVKARSGGREWKAVYHAGDGIPKPHFPESAWRANGYMRVVPVDGDGFPVLVADRGLSAEERAVNLFREVLNQK